MARIFSIITLVYFFIATVSAQPGPDTLWTNIYSPANHGYYINQTSDGGYIVTGQCYFPGGNEWDVYFLKVNAEGDFQWQQLSGGDYDDVGFAVHETWDGGYIAAGYSEVAPDSALRVYVAKTDMFGAIQWANTYGESFYKAIAYDITPVGNDSWVFAGQALQFAVDSSWIYIGKIDAGGNTIWTRTIGAYQYQTALSIRQTADGGFIIAGDSSPDLVQGVPSLTKTDSLGNIIWTIIFEGTNNELPAYGDRVVETNDGGYAIVVKDYIGASTRYVLIKVDQSGNELWRHNYGGVVSKFPFSLDITSDGGFVMIGWPNFYMVKTDPDGVMEWEKTVSGGSNAMGYCIKQTADGGYIAVGFQSFFYGGSEQCYIYTVCLDSEIPTLYVDLTPEDDNIEIPAGGGSFDYNIRVVNSGLSAENFDIWAEIELPMTGTVPIFDVEGITLPAQSEISRNRTQSVPGYAPAGNYLYRAYIGEYPWIVEFTDSFEFEKLGSDGISLGNPGDWICTGEAFHQGAMEEADLSPDKVHCSISPNPFNQSTVISYKLQAASYMELKVYDITGREAAKLIDGYQNVGNHEITFNAKDLVSGVYFVRLKAGDFTATQKLLLIK